MMNNKLSTFVKVNDDMSINQMQIGELKNGKFFGISFDENSSTGEQFIFDGRILDLEREEAESFFETLLGDLKEQIEFKRNSMIRENKLAEPLQGMVWDNVFHSPNFNGLDLAKLDYIEQNEADTIISTVMKRVANELDDDNEDSAINRLMRQAEEKSGVFAKIQAPSLSIVSDIADAVESAEDVQNMWSEIRGNSSEKKEKSGARNRSRG